MNDKMTIFIFSVNVINRLLLSFLVLTKGITLSGVHCNLKLILKQAKHKNIEISFTLVLKFPHFVKTSFENICFHSKIARNVLLLLKAVQFTSFQTEKQTFVIKHEYLLDKSNVWFNLCIVIRIDDQCFLRNGAKQLQALFSRLKTLQL